MTSPVLPPNVTVLSRLDEDHAEYSVADPRVMQALSKAEDRHFWHGSRNRFIAARLARLGAVPPARFLELGCGGGAVAAHLAGVGYQVTGVDGHLVRVLVAAVRAPSALFVVHDLSAGTAGLGARDFDAVGLFDVLEHLAAPERALTDALACARPGGLVVGTVPALMALWSEVDVHARHRLRYDRASLRGLLGAVPGAQFVEIADFNRQLVPMMWLQRRLVVTSGDEGATAEDNLRTPPSPLNQALRWSCTLERWMAALLDRTPLPGASLWFALRRTAG